MLYWVKRKAVERAVKFYINKGVNKMFADLWKALDGKKTKLGDTGTYILTVLGVLFQIVSDPTFHSFLQQVVVYIPSWGIYVTAAISTIGRLDAFRKNGLPKILAFINGLKKV